MSCAVGQKAFYAGRCTHDVSLHFLSEFFYLALLLLNLSLNLVHPCLPLSFALHHFLPLPSLSPGLQVKASEIPHAVSNRLVGQNLVHGTAGNLFLLFQQNGQPLQLVDGLPLLWL